MPVCFYYKTTNVMKNKYYADYKYIISFGILLQSIVEICLVCKIIKRISVQRNISLCTGFFADDRKKFKILTIR